VIHREISDKKYQMDSLDGLRGLAALIVVFSHTSNCGMFFIPFLDLSGIGKSGVFLFFLLSSFLLTLPLLRKGKEIFTFPVMSHYWQRRFFRIYPLYTLYLLLGVISTWVIAAALGKSGMGIPFALDWSGFINHLALLEGKGITWSIAVEFKFYFILPFFVLAIVFIRSYGPGVTILFFLLLLLLSQAIFPQSESMVNDTRLLPYMPIFIIGMFLAVLQEYINLNESNKVITSICRCLGYLGVVGVIVMTPLVFSFFGDRVAGNYFHKQFILYALFWSFIILSSVNVQGLLLRFFTLPILRFYGAISFGLYLFHPIFIGALRRFEINGYMSSWLVLLGSTATAYISFRLIEGPISQYKLSRSALVPIAHLTKRFTRAK
jgi:peptidoglycan/LPS O-acetylase OafA/YrhL